MDPYNSSPYDEGCTKPFDFSKRVVFYIVLSIILMVIVFSFKLDTRIAIFVWILLTTILFFIGNSMWGSIFCSDRNKYLSLIQNLNMTPQDAYKQVEQERQMQAQRNFMNRQMNSNTRYNTPYNTTSIGLNGLSLQF